MISKEKSVEIASLKEERERLNTKILELTSKLSEIPIKSISDDSKKVLPKPSTNSTPNKVKDLCKSCEEGDL